MVYVTHDQEEALSLGDRVVVLNHGQVQQADRPAVLYKQPANVFVARFLGWPPINLLTGKLVAKEGQVRLVENERQIVAPIGLQQAWQAFTGMRVTLGIRPEHVLLRSQQDGKRHDQATEVVLTMEVRQVVRRGPQTRLTLQHGDWTVTMDQEEAGSLREHSLIEATLDLSRAHLFDQGTGRALSHGLPGG
jgi:ABC-type sugar transport system ATPase subunit